MAQLPTVTVGAAAGTGGVATMDGASDDRHANITVTTGASGAVAGLLATINFGGSWTGFAGLVTARAPVVQATNVVNTLGSLSAVIAADKRSMAIYCTGTPTASTAYLISVGVDI